MPEIADLHATAIETIYSLAANDRLTWEKKSNESYTARVGGTSFDIDKSAIGDKVLYVLWIFRNGSIASRIDGNGLTGRAIPPGFPDYQAIIRATFALAESRVRNTALQEALNELESFRASNS